MEAAEWIRSCEFLLSSIVSKPVSLLTSEMTSQLQISSAEQEGAVRKIIAARSDDNEDVKFLTVKFFFITACKFLLENCIKMRVRTFRCNLGLLALLHKSKNGFIRIFVLHFCFVLQEIQ